MYTIDIALSATLTGHQNPIFSLAKSSHPSHIFSAGNDKGVVEWDLEAGKFKRILCSVPASVYAMELLEERSILVIGLRNGEIWCVDIDKQILVRKMSTERGAVFALKSIPEKGELIAIGEEGVAYVWSLENFDLLYRFRVSTTTVRTIESYPGGNQVAFGDKDGYIHLYDVAEFKAVEKKKIHSMPVTALAASELYLYSGGRDAQLFQLTQKDLSIAQHLTAHMFTVYRILVHPQEAILATISRDKSIKIWERSSLALLKNVSVDRGFDAHRLSINTGMWFNNQLITAGDDKLIKVWNVTFQEK
ncbi:WD40 repeat domain-containing protein [Sphingobacterium sp. LRF_L2]|uniref:WD40 repeat domain-containing protein n=1 Tax=Sphingobacterium sp. LRF_L2 TaxID=3369421 RepID=UPI003F62ED79